MDRLMPSFAALQLTATASAATAALSTGATRLRINLQSTGSRSIAIPALAEQEEIVGVIWDTTRTVREGIKRAESEVDLLREYRTRLIADVATGKVDVREAAARLSVEVEEPESLDEVEAETDTDEVLREAEA